MALFKKKTKDEAGSKSEAPKKSVSPKKPSVAKKPAKNIGLILSVIKTSLITEKASILAEQNKYVFKVEKPANKIQIKKAIEGLYNVTVLKVNVLSSPGKTRQRGLTKGRRPGYKKAIVSLKAGDKIDTAI